MKKLGIYFGLNAVNVVESDGKKIINQFQIPSKSGEFSGRGSLNILLQDELRKANIKNEDTVITLASKDLLIRSFDLPLMPANELPAAINSEAVKYIPFKMEDIIFDYKILINKKERRNYVLFAGIKSDDLDGKYLSVLSAAMLKPKEIEYAVFSALKLLKTSGISEKGVHAFLDIDLEDESNITILDNDFPQFSRTLKIPVEEATDKTTSANVLDKLVSEIRISLDFYRRKFPEKDIKTAIVAVKNELRFEIENVCRDLGVKAIFINLPVSLNDLGLVKAYAASLDIKLPFDIDLLAGKEKVRLHREKSTMAGMRAPISSDAVKVKKSLVVIGLLVAIGVFALLQYNKIMPLKNEISQVLSQRKNLATVSTALPYNELGQIEMTYKEKVDTLDRLFKDKKFLTPKFDYIPKLIPEGVWLMGLDFTSAGNTLIMKGAAFLENSETEISAINQFVTQLQNSVEFGKSFDIINVANVKKGAIGDIQDPF